MSDDRFLDRLREDARGLRFEPDEIAVHRVAARVRDQLASQPSISQVLVRWFRPASLLLSAIAFAAVLGLAWVGSAAEETAAVQSVELNVGGEVFSVSE